MFVRGAQLEGPRVARVWPKTQAESRQQQSAVSHNPFMLVTVPFYSQMGLMGLRGAGSPRAADERVAFRNCG